MLLAGADRLDGLDLACERPAQSFSLPPKWLPTDLAWRNYAQVFESVPFAEILLNSVKVSVAIVLGQLVTASLAGYAFARLRFPGKNVLFILLMASLMVPGQATIIPVFLLIKWFGLADTLWSLILPAWVSAFGVFFMRQAFMQIPQDLVDAAKIDGANQWQIFSRVFLPLCAGPMAVLAILSFNTFWNEFFRPLIFLSSQTELHPAARAGHPPGLPGHGQPVGRARRRRDLDAAGPADLRLRPALRHRRHRPHGREGVTRVYAPPAAIGPELGDVEVFAAGDQLHLFHLTLPNHDVVQHVVSDDGLAWRALPAAIRTSDPGEGPDDDMIYTMSVTEHGGTYYMVYTALGRAEAGRIQRIAVATSHGPDPLDEARGQPGRRGRPALVRGRAAGRAAASPGATRSRSGSATRSTRWSAGREKDGPFLRRGCAALMASDDLLNWEVRPPLFAPRRYWDLECPQVFTVDAHYYLTAGIMEDRSQRYWQAPAFEGPYTVPADGGILAPAGHYAGRVCRWRDLDLFVAWHRPMLTPGVVGRLRLAGLGHAGQHLREDLDAAAGAAAAGGRQPAAEQLPGLGGVPRRRPDAASLAGASLFRGKSRQRAGRSRRPRAPTWPSAPTSWATSCSRAS